MYQVIGSIETNGTNIEEWVVAEFNSRGQAKQLSNNLMKWVIDNNIWKFPNPLIKECSLDPNFKQGIDGVIYFFRKKT